MEGTKINGRLNSLRDEQGRIYDIILLWSPLMRSALMIAVEENMHVLLCLGELSTTFEGSNFSVKSEHQTAPLPVTSSLFAPTLLLLRNPGGTG